MTEEKWVEVAGQLMAEIDRNIERIVMEEIRKEWAELEPHNEFPTIDLEA